ncbi:MAG TPA: BlaI/MecI/CopY family transcriptional regulator [Saprospiraceae bacterium]|nr:BlaI/MecI/CopY family transcriptional regulator [Saprospiraceae bacterium]
MKRAKQSTIPPLTKAEEEIMHYVWQLGRCTVTDILEKLGKPRPPHSTISSIVRILEKKGYVDHKAYGRTHEYFPKVTKEGVLRNRLKNLVTQYFEGSPNALVNFLVKEKDLSPADLKELVKKTDLK